METKEHKFSFKSIQSSLKLQQNTLFLYEAKEHIYIGQWYARRTFCDLSQRNSILYEAR
jgi:hypothetical protein